MGIWYSSSGLGCPLLKNICHPRQDRDDECDRLSIEDLDDDDEPIIVSVSVQDTLFHLYNLFGWKTEKPHELAQTQTPMDKNHASYLFLALNVRVYFVEPPTDSY